MKKLLPLQLLAAGILAVVTVASSVALAQDKYPSRPIRLIVPFPAGGAGRCHGAV